MLHVMLRRSCYYCIQTALALGVFSRITVLFLRSSIDWLTGLRFKPIVGATCVSLGNGPIRVRSEWVGEETPKLIYPADEDVSIDPVIYLS